MRFFLFPILAIVFFVFPLSHSKAAQEDILLNLPDGQVVLSISATERKEVEQDLLVGTLSYVATNRDARALQNEINTAMAKAIDEAKKVDSIKVNTGAYQVYETTIPRTREKQWRGQQTMTIKSKNAEDLLELTGRLQDMKLTMNGLSYMLSPETAVEIQDGLMEDALKQLQERATRAAKALGKSSAELRDVRVQSSGVPRNFSPPPIGIEPAARTMAMAAPVAAAGETTITLSVNARAILKP